MIGNHDFDDQHGEPSLPATELRTAELRRLMACLGELTELDTATSAAGSGWCAASSRRRENG